MTTHEYRPGKDEPGDHRQACLPSSLATLLADREGQARAHRRHLHLTLWPSVLFTFSLGVLAGLAMVCG